MLRKHTSPHRIGPFKRWLLTTMAAVMLLPTVLLASAQPAQAQWGFDNWFDNAANPDPWTATAAFLNSIGNSTEGCKKFFTQPNGNPSGDCDGARGENHLITYAQRKDSSGDGEVIGYDPGDRPVAARIKKLKGNPYMIVGAEAHGDFRPENFPAGVETGQMRFVLAEINNKSKDDLDFTGSEEGNVFIWRNEFNPNLAIEKFYKPSGDVPVPGISNVNSSDEAHFAYDPQCVGSFGEGTQISDTDLRDDPPGTDEESKEELQKWLEENKIKLNRICDENLNFFAQAMQNALESVASFLGGLIDGLSNALGDIVDVGTIAQVPGLTNAWKTIRDFVNIIFILILSVVAFSTIIRFDTEKYSVRALLPRLVFAVIAVNFSLLLVQILTNFAFIVSQPFQETAFALVTNPPANGSLIEPSAGIGEAAMAILVLLVIIIAMVILLCFFVVRILVIWLLAALSPFVFLFMVLPVTRSLAGAWWKNAVKWIFMAPIAFVILFIAAEVVSGGRETAQSTEDPGFILKIGFFAGALIAAVIIPMKLGGEVMGRAVSGAQKSGRFGRKGAGLGAKAAGASAMMAADKVPSGGGVKLGTRMRATGMALGLPQKSTSPGSRAAFRQGRAEEHLQNQIAEGKGAGRLVGASAGQITQARQQALAKANKEMAQITPSGKRRIAYAQSGLGKVGKNGEVFDESGNSLGLLQKDEKEFAKSRLHSEAAYSDLAQAGQDSPQLAEAYAPSGLPQLNAHNPVTASLDRNGQYSERAIGSKIAYATHDNLKDWDSDFYKAAAEYAQGQHRGSEYHKQAYEGLRKNLDATRAAFAVTRGHRNSMPQEAQRHALHEFAQAGGFQDPATNKAVIDSFNKKEPVF